MESSDGKRFGHRVWADLLIVEKKEEQLKKEDDILEEVLNQQNINSSQNSAPAQLSESHHWTNVLQQLDEMGFNDRQLNMRMLVECEGDVLRAIQKLLQK